MISQPSYARWIALWTVLVFRPIVQGDETRRDFSQWEKEIAAYETADLAHPPAKGSLVFVGSSVFAQWRTLASDFYGRPVINRAFGGSQIVDSTHFADRIIFPYEPTMVFLRAGGNDLWAGKSPVQVASDFEDFASTIHRRLPSAIIVYVSQSPSIARWSQHERDKQMNDLIEAYVRAHPYLRFADTYDMVLGPNGLPRPELFVDDKLHLNKEGYKLLAERVRPFLPK